MTHDLKKWMTHDELTRLIACARHEDLGSLGMDVTSAVTLSPTQQAVGTLVARQPGIVAGMALLETILAAYDKNLTHTAHLHDGDLLAPQTPIATLFGPIISMLAAERVILNFLTHLSGIASLTKQYVDRIQNTDAHIYDTRKTIPGLRHLAKYAVACGQGKNHRIGLYDAVLIKDNHIAHVAPEQLPQFLRDAFAKARKANPAIGFIEVEVDTLEQLEHVLPCKPDLILLDNMTLVQLKQAVQLCDASCNQANQDDQTSKPTIALEASGGVTLQTVYDIAQTGVNRIAVGAITHSAPALDIGLDIH